jgi:predicted AAA+ superfamily ATPase
LYQSLVANPNRLDNLIPPHYSNWIIIDEVQRIPELLNEVHRLIEHKKYKFILTGSSACSLRRMGINLLAGRALKYTMHPLVIQELGDSFDTEKAVRFGLLPSVINHADAKKYLSNK